jgi:putative ABC transport system permease protein
MDRISLYFRYALRSFIRVRSRSIFGAFCVAVGVGSVVGLGLVGGNFQDAVTGNAQKLNRGDVALAAPVSLFTLKDYRYFQALKARGDITDFQSLLRVDAQIRSPSDRSRTVIGAGIAVQAQKFPYYDTVTADDPSGAPLKDLLRGPNDAVVSHTVFDQLGLSLGSPVTIDFRFGGARTLTVRGVVPDNTPDPGFGSGLFPYWVIMDRSAMASYITANDNAGTQIYMTTRDAASANRVKAELKVHFGALANPKTIADVQKDSVNGADGFNKFFRIMSLIAVVIGGIGIINTMLVAARRRQGEIAVLKTVGMQGRQVILAFTFEALLLAIAGTIVGVFLGMLVSSAVNSVTQSLAGYTIPWSLHIRPLIAGVLVGILATLLFGYLPIVRASRVRPSVVLRAEGADGPRRGWFRRLASGFLHTGLLVLLLAAVIGYLAILYTGLYSGPQTVIYGVISGVATLVITGLLTGLFVGIIWLVSHLPAFGRLSARMAFRSMRTQKRRLASTLLGLCVGILAVGSIAILAQNIKDALAQSLEKHQNFNVMVQMPHDAAVQAQVNAAIAKLPGVQHRDNGAIANLLALSSVDGVSLNDLIPIAVKLHGTDSVSSALQNVRGVVGHDARGNADNYVMKLGRNLDARDAGTNHIEISDDFASPFGIKLGSHLVYREGSRQVAFTVIGITDSNNFMVGGESLVDVRYMQRVGMTAPSPSHNALVFLDIAHGNLDADVSTLRRTLPTKVLVLDLNSFLEFTQIIDKFALFPEIIGGLALFAGVIIIANTVALAMLERRREFGIMKAVGAKRRTILQFLLIENAIVGFLGAGVGVLLAMLASALLANMIGIGTGFNWGVILVLIGVGMVLSISASALTAYPASGERPMTVLRYE